MSLFHGRTPKGAPTTGTNPVMVGGENAAGNAETWKVESGVGAVSVSGSKSEVLSAQVSLIAGTATTYNRSSSANEIEIYCESGSVRVRTDGTACTATTGEPMGVGFSKIWSVASVSIYAVANSVVTEVSR